MKKSALAVVGATALLAAAVGTASAATAADDSKDLTPEVKARLLSAQSPATTKATHAGLVGNGTYRSWGDDRYETAVAISQGIWTEDNTGAVYLAVGDRFPDAVAASASSAQLGPILFTETNHLPDVTRAELERLRPCLIFVVGAENAVSAAVATDADQYTNPERCFS